MLEGALHIHGCLDASSLPTVYAAHAATPKGGGEDRVAGSLTDLCERARHGDNYSARLPPLHKRLVHVVPTLHHKFERLGEQDHPAPSLSDVYDSDTGTLRHAAGILIGRLAAGVVSGQSRVLPTKSGATLTGVGDGVRPPVTDVFCDGGIAQGDGAPPEHNA